MFDNGLPICAHRLGARRRAARLITPRYWAAKSGGRRRCRTSTTWSSTGDGPTLDEMIAQTERALLVTCFWYIRTVDPQTALDTGLTRDGVFLVEHGEVSGAVNNFRWNMSPIAALAQATADRPERHGAAARARRVPAGEGAAAADRALQHELGQRVN